MLILCNQATQKRKAYLHRVLRRQKTCRQRKAGIEMDNKMIKEKYGKTYHMPPEVTYDWVKKDCIEKAPI